MFYAIWRGGCNVRAVELVGVAQPIERCGAFCGVGSGCLIPDGRMWPLVIVVFDPGFEFRPGMIQAQEQGFVEQFIAHSSVETFTKAVLHRFPGRDKVPVDDMLLRPGRLSGKIPEARLRHAGQARKTICLLFPRKSAG